MFWYRCVNGHEFKAPEFEEPYGRLMLRTTKTGSEAWVNCDTDPVFSEVGHLAAAISDYRSLGDHAKGRLVHKAFSAATDPGDDGSPYVVGACPRCPTCGTLSTKGWVMTDPPERRDIHIPHVAHTRWNATPLAERGVIVQTLIERGDYLADPTCLT